MIYLEKKSIVELPKATGSIVDTLNVEDTETNAPSLNIANSLGLPTNGIVEYPDDLPIPEGYEKANIQPNIYSTDEVVIGKWIDEKPLYRKVIITKSPSAISSDQVIGNLGTNINELISLKGMIDLGEAAGIVPIPQVFNSENINCLWLSNYSTGNIMCIVNVPAYVDRRLVIIVEYTKTTD